MDTHSLPAPLTVAVNCYRRRLPLLRSLRLLFKPPLPWSPLLWRLPRHHLRVWSAPAGAAPATATLALAPTAASAAAAPTKNRAGAVLCFCFKERLEIRKSRFSAVRKLSSSLQRSHKTSLTLLPLSPVFTLVKGTGFLVWKRKARNMRPKGKRGGC